MDEDEYTRMSGNNNEDEEGSQEEEEDEESQEETEDNDPDPDNDGEGDNDNDNDNNTVIGSSENNNSTIIQATPTLASLNDPERVNQVREMTEAVWSLSTAKPGNGVAQIMDSSPDTYWQSDGPQPHLINIHFAKRKGICEVAFYLDYSLDESYTPQRIGIKAGVTFHDLEEIKVVEMNEPVGWISVPLYAAVDPLDDDFMEGKDEDEDMDDEEKERQREKRRKILWRQSISAALPLVQRARDVSRWCYAEACCRDHSREEGKRRERKGEAAEYINDAEGP